MALKCCDMIWRHYVIRGIDPDLFPIHSIPIQFTIPVLEELTLHYLRKLYPRCRVACEEGIHSTKSKNIHPPVKLDGAFFIHASATNTLLWRVATSHEREERGGMNITQSGFFAEGGNANPPSSDNYGCRHRRLCIHPQRFCISITEGTLKAPKPIKRVMFLLAHVFRLGDYTLGSCKTSVSQILRAWVVPHRNASGRSQRRGLWKF